MTTEESPADQPGEQELRDRIAELETRIDEYHRSELSRWADSVAEGQYIFDELDRMRATVSWRVTAPLRVVRVRQNRK
jgi:hypothetical protein